MRQLPSRTWHWRNLALVALIVGASMLLPHPAHARSIDVRAGDPLPTGWFVSISEALAAVDPNAIPPDIVFIHKPISGLSSYNESLEITKTVRLVAVESEEDPGPVIIEGNGSRVITVEGPASGPPIDVSISGFTIRNGNASSAGSFVGQGGGLMLINATGLIENNIIANNIASASTAQSGYGGGVYIQGGAPLLRGNTIEDNAANQNALDGSLGFGGGILISQSAARLEGNIIRNNRAATGGNAGYGHGGGVYISDDDTLPSSPALVGNTIQANTGGDSSINGSGGGVYVSDSNATLASNTITGNLGGSLGDCFGGGIAVFDTPTQSGITRVLGTPTLRDNVLDANTAGEATARHGHGGGLAILGGLAHVQHNQISANTGGGEEGIGGGVYINTTPVTYSLTLEANAIVGNNAMSAGSPGMAGGVYGYLANLVLINNLVAQNTDTAGASGILADGGVTELEHTTIADNHSIGVAGSGVWLRAQAQVNGVNNLVSGNGTGVYAEGSGTSANLRRTLFQGNTAPTGNDGQATVQTEDNVAGDPQFIAPVSANYRIGATSAARNAGEATSVTIDADLHLRLGSPDIGAYEYRIDLFLPWQNALSQGR